MRFIGLVTTAKAETTPTVGRVPLQIAIPIARHGLSTLRRPDEARSLTLTMLVAIVVHVATLTRRSRTYDG